MERIKSFIASVLIALIMFAGFGFGIMAIGFAIVVGGAFALAVWLGGPRLIEKAEQRVSNENVEASSSDPAAA